MTRTKKILVIDDDAAGCELIDRTLQQQGFMVTTTQDARTGFEIAQRLLPDLIFLKLMLPGIDGLKVSKAIHAVPALTTVPVVMIIAQEGELDPKYTAAIGIVDALARPLHPHEIIAKTHAVLGEAAVAGSGRGLMNPLLDGEGFEPAIVVDSCDATEDEMPGSAMGTDIDKRRHHASYEVSKSSGPDHLATDDALKDLSSGKLLYALRAGVEEQPDLFSTVPLSSGDEKKALQDGV